MAGPRRPTPAPPAAPHALSDNFGGHNESEASQMPPSSQTSYNDDDNQPSSRSPPRAPRAMRRGSRTVTPPPPQTPSPSYIALAEQPPSRLKDPTSLRKLLVLDLNGTLLHRSPNTTRVRYHERARDSKGNLLPRLRSVHPRPYMPAFRSYLFTEQTRSWLDVMVWSSAQPHSVSDMVDKCFGEDKEKIIAVWARDTLGLSNAHYFQKVQTVKDLTKPWLHLAPQSSAAPSPDSSIASTPRSSPEPSSPSHTSNDSTFRPANGVSPTVHSALTTLLLDDSPRKAELQPFNHVCIVEYTGDLRSRDVDNMQKEQDWNAAVDARQQLDTSMTDTDTPLAAELAPSDADASASLDELSCTQSPTKEQDAPDLSPDEIPQEMSKKRKRKEKKLQKRVALLEQFSDDGKPEASYDETLLAVIGVLDEIKCQANVAAWIRTGGLWGTHRPLASRSPKLQVLASSESCDVAPTDAVTQSIPDEADAVQSDDSILSVGKDCPATRRDDSEIRRRMKKRKRNRRPNADGQTDVAVVGNDDETAVLVPSSNEEREEIREEHRDEVHQMWFEDSEVIAYWISRGRQALDELGIPAEHGLER